MCERVRRATSEYGYGWARGKTINKSNDKRRISRIIFFSPSLIVKLYAESLVNYTQWGERGRSEHGIYVVLSILELTEALCSHLQREWGTIAQVRENLQKNLKRICSSFRLPPFVSGSENKKMREICYLEKRFGERECFYGSLMSSLPSSDGEARRG